MPRLTIPWPGWCRGVTRRRRRAGWGWGGSAGSSPGSRSWPPPADRHADTPLESIVAFECVAVDCGAGVCFPTGTRTFDSVQHKWPHIHTDGINPPLVKFPFSHTDPQTWWCPCRFCHSWSVTENTSRRGICYMFLWARSFLNISHDHVTAELCSDIWPDHVPHHFLMTRSKKDTMRLTATCPQYGSRRGVYFKNVNLYAKHPLGRVYWL